MKVRAKLHSLGTKRESMTTAPEMTKRQKVEVTFPSLSLNSAQVPAVEKLQRGDKCFIVLEAEVTGTRDAERYDDAGKDWKDAVIANFELKKGSIQPVTKMHKTMDEAYEAASKETKS